MRAERDPVSQKEEKACQSVGREGTIDDGKWADVLRGINHHLQIRSSGRNKIREQTKTLEPTYRPSSPGGSSGVNQPLCGHEATSTARPTTEEPCPPNVSRYWREQWLG